jgi:DMSO/TMAO reductase YedYZ molybdopterin-dependent catalytic subunit
MKRSGILPAILSAVLLAAPLIALSYDAWRWLGLPFIPFDVFDALSRILPGIVITRSIEAMITIIHGLNLGATAAVAKIAEQALAVTLFFLLLVIAATLFLLTPRKGKDGSGFRSGAALGTVLAFLLAIPVSNGQTSLLEPAVAMLWTFGLLILWGLILGWLDSRFSRTIPAYSQPARVEALGRRQILIRLGEASALITFAGAVVGALARGNRNQLKNSDQNKAPWSETQRLPNADAPVKPAPGTRPEFTPLESHYRIDINTVPPSIKGEDWRLRITGLVEKPQTLTLDDIRKLDPMHQFVTISCISNLIAGDLIGTTRWSGVSMQRILQEIHPLPNATHLKIRSADGFYETVALDTIRSDPRVMLTYEWDGLPLTAEHGFPLRIYIPDRYGMKQPKWIQSIEVMDHLEEGYWVERGWDALARMRATSVIDTMSSNMMIAERNGSATIPLGGIAHAGARDISKVQVKVDNDPWRDAELRAPLSETTWVIWRYDWPFKPGRHTITVRCFEGDGTPQITVEAPPHPSGATGLHSLTANL